MPTNPPIPPNAPSSQRQLPPFDGTLPYFPQGAPPGYFDQPPLLEGPKKTILFAWELGACLGHMMQILPIAQALAQQGHTVYVALRNLERSAQIFGQAGVRFLQSPLISNGPILHPQTLTFTELLINCGFASDLHLFPQPRPSSFPNSPLTNPNTMLTYLRPKCLYT
jgi:hypothetical protein